MDMLFNIPETDDEYIAYKAILPFLQDTIEENYAPQNALSFRKLASSSSVFYYSALLFRICIRKNSSYVAFFTTKPEQYPTLEMYQIGSDTKNNFFRFNIKTPCDICNYSDALCKILEAAILNQPKEMDICDLYMECSDAKRCVNKNRELSLHCGYKRILNRGSVFYGKNRNVEENGATAMRIQARPDKGKSLLECPCDYVALDLETTGLVPAFDDIIEIALVRVKDSIPCETFQTLVNPGYEIDEFITDLTGITNEMLSTAPSIEDVLPNVASFIGQSVIVGHNVHFDVNFLYDAFTMFLNRSLNNDVYDTLRLSRRLFPDVPDHRLETMLIYFEIPSNQYHRALADAISAHKCAEYIRQYIQTNNIQIKKLFQHSSGRNWSAKDIVPTSEEFDEDNPFYHQQVVFTGALNTMTRKEAMQRVVNLGGTCWDYVSKKTNYLVLGDYSSIKNVKGKSTKHKAAEKLILKGADLHIIDESVFLDLLRNYEV